MGLGGEKRRGQLGVVELDQNRWLGGGAAFVDSIAFLIRKAEDAGGDAGADGDVGFGLNFAGGADGFNEIASDDRLNAHHGHLRRGIDAVLDPPTAQETQADEDHDNDEENAEEFSHA